MSVTLSTSRYATFIPAMGVPCATSLGRPKFPLSYDLSEEVGALKPFGLLGKDLSEDAFTAAYRERLDRTGVYKFWRLFYAISNRHGGTRVVLLCFEPLDQFCHRRVFADWWAEQTGSHVPELSWLLGTSGAWALCSPHRDGCKSGDHGTQRKEQQP